MMDKSQESLPDHPFMPRLGPAPHFLLLLAGVFLANSQATSIDMYEKLGLLKLMYAWGLGREILSPRDSLPHVRAEVPFQHGAQC